MFSWQSLPTPFFCLAPMENVTDTVFRQIVASTGKPAVFFTEFTNTDGMTSKGRAMVEKRLLFTEQERPIIAQIWGTNPQNFYETAKILVEKGFDGIDINMGCPVRDVIQHGSCSALIENLPLAKEIIQATKDGAKSASWRMPVSVKTRIGLKTKRTEEWVSFLLEQDIAALTIHGRTAAEMSKAPAHWDEIAKAVAIRNEMKKDTVIIGNGDVVSFTDGIEKARSTGVDGIMVGRGIFQNLWLFDESKDITSISPNDRLSKLMEHVLLYEKTWGKEKHFEILKKFVKAYVHSFDGASELRAKLMETRTSEDLLSVTNDYLEKNI